ncbi:hypothetical protein [Paenibacillus phocaensis]|uniref:hypothetical protein n=1 Tax=Paenibacillus phocaensis TaxID=1776378 RepID=UPI000839B3A0|nr:hypothetical protein [Paenibacillus phocaensis]
MIKSKYFIEKFNQHNIKVLAGLMTADKIDIFFNYNDIDEFLIFTTELEMNYVFMNVDYLKEHEIEFITNEVLEDYGSPHEYVRDIQKEVQAYNEKMKKLQKRVGEEQSIHFFFSHNGSIYSWLSVDEELEYEDADTFLEELIDNYDNEIKEYKENQRSSNISMLLKNRNEIERLILSDNDFKYHTTKDLRRTFSNMLYEANRDFFKSIKLHEYQLFDFVEITWNKYKDNVKKK